MTSELLQDLPRVHHQDIVFGPLGATKILLMWDYQHAGDRGMRYRLEDILSDVQSTIDSLFLTISGLLALCEWTREYFPPAEMEPFGSRGALINRAIRATRDAHQATAAR
jgi:hypothetical protein